MLNVEDLAKEPYASILCYPHAEPSETERRIDELKELGITSVEFLGDIPIYGIPVLGKGQVGVVIVAIVGGERSALKMHRLDSNRDNFFTEAEMLKYANGAGVGPRFISVSKNFMLSQYIDGGLLADRLSERKEKAIYIATLTDVLEQCRRLDEAGIDHGELSEAHRHLLVDSTGKPFIVDFETASLQRRTSNVTSVCQHLFLGNSVISKLVREVLGEIDKDLFRIALRNYKNEHSEEHFEALLRACLSGTS
jgi:putative serine/threonine protein kinase